MAFLNSVFLIGNLGKDPVMRYTSNGASVCNLSLATTRYWTDKTSGERREETEWHRIVLYDPLAKIAGEYLKKGRPVFIRGRLKYRKWKEKETDQQERFITEIIAEEMQLLGGRDTPSSHRSGPDADHDFSAPPNREPRAAKPEPDFGDLDDDIPF